MADDNELYEPLIKELERDATQLRESVNLRGHEHAGIRTLRYGLHTSRLSSATLKYLATTSTEFTRALVDDLLKLARAERNTEAVRRLLGRLTYQDQAKVVPPGVFKILDAEHIGPDRVDYSDWRRMAEVLYHLGLFDALRELCDRARDSIDGDIREVAEDFGDA